MNDPFGNRIEFLDPISIGTEDPGSGDAKALVGAMCAELKTRCGGEPSAFATGEALPPHGGFVIARSAGIPVGCGAFRRLEDTVAEVKRMFVLPAYRGRRIARQILSELERLAQSQGYRMVRLETSERQLEAITFYETSGYRRRPPFGDYAENPTSVCFEKVLQ